MATHQVVAMEATVVPDVAMELRLWCVTVDATEVVDGTEW
jgi:hypothetical protein